MEKVNNQKGVNFDEIKFVTEIVGGRYLCTISFNLCKYALIQQGAGNYHKQDCTSNYCRDVRLLGFDLEREKDLVRRIICTYERRKELDKERKKYTEHKL